MKPQKIVIEIYGDNGFDVRFDPKTSNPREMVVILGNAIRYVIESSDRVEQGLEEALGIIAETIYKPHMDDLVFVMLLGQLASRYIEGLEIEQEKGAEAPWKH